jgi:hypothetical protein
MGKCKFNDKWLEKDEYDWLRSVPGSAYDARCTMCKKTFKLGTMGIRAVESHVQSQKHKAYSKARLQPTITSFCSTASNDVIDNASVAIGNPQPVTSMPSDRAICGSTPTLRAEVIWVMRTVTSHHSCRSNVGLAPYIKKELVNEVQKCGAFVVMFDETLNQTTKTKQMDLHVLYWLNDHVQSRFYGSQFMGHATAQDLLQHFKVSMPYIYL